MEDFANFWTTADTSSTAPTARQRDPVPTGTYNVWIEKAQLDLTKNRVTMWYKIEEGEHSGRILFANYTLNQVGTAMLKEELLKFGAPEKMKSLNELGEFLNTLYGKKCEVYAKHRTFAKSDGTTGDAHNVYVNSTLAQPAANNPFADTANDEIPF